MGQRNRQLIPFAVVLVAASVMGCQTKAQTLTTPVRPLLNPVVNELTLAHQMDQPRAEQALLFSATREETPSLPLNQQLVNAVENGDWQTAEALLTQGAVPDAGDYVTGYVLPIAAKNNNLKLVQLLVERGAEVDIAGQDGETALAKAINQKNLDIAAYLLKQGAYPNQAVGGKPMLVLAIHTGHPELVELLLKNGANPKPEAVSLLQTTTAAQQQAQNRYKTITQMLTSAGAK